MAHGKTKKIYRECLEYNRFLNDLYNYIDEQVFDYEKIPEYVEDFLDMFFESYFNVYEIDKNGASLTDIEVSDDFEVNENDICVIDNVEYHFDFMNMDDLIFKILLDVEVAYEEKDT